MVNIQKWTLLSTSVDVDVHVDANRSYQSFRVWKIHQFLIQNGQKSCDHIGLDLFRYLSGNIFLKLEIFGAL